MGCAVHCGAAGGGSGGAPPTGGGPLRPRPCTLQVSSPLRSVIPWHIDIITHKETIGVCSRTWMMDCPLTLRCPLHIFVNPWDQAAELVCYISRQAGHNASR